MVGVAWLVPEIGLIFIVSAQSRFLYELRDGSTVVGAGCSVVCCELFFGPLLFFPLHGLSLVFLLCPPFLLEFVYLVEGPVGCFCYAPNHSRQYTSCGLIALPIVWHVGPCLIDIG